MHRVGGMVLIQLLLPAKPAHVETSEGTLGSLAQTRRELSAQFAGLTAYTRSPAKGVWTAADGHVEHDDVVMVEVVTDTFDRPWWRNYTATLAERFNQDSIHVRAISIQMTDDDD